MIVVQPGPNVNTGNIIVTVNGKGSNPQPFTLRSGSISFRLFQTHRTRMIQTPGTYVEPFKTLYRPRQVMQTGDIVYIKGGTLTPPIRSSRLGRHFVAHS